MNIEFLEAVSSLFDGTTPQINDEIRHEAKLQAVYSLIGSGDDVYSAIYNNVLIAHEQNTLNRVLSDIPFVVLKGLSVAIYYPNPLRRSLGDIDIIVRPEDFVLAYNSLVSAGYTTANSFDYVGRHAHFYHNGVLIELHRRFGIFSERKNDDLLDRWIFGEIPNAVTGRINDIEFPMLPPVLNGLILLTHIGYHIESGLGLRHILDWIMYVDKELPDEKWQIFKRKADQLGLTNLAITVAHIGQIYFHALQDYGWCKNADENLCKALLEYVLSCGNFGRKLGMDNTVTGVLVKSSGQPLLYLQKRGEMTWAFLKTHPEFKPVAWIYQALRFINRGLRKGIKLSNLKTDYFDSKRRRDLIKKLGVKQQTLVDKNDI